MALWQMKTLIRDRRVSILFFFNPYPGAFAGLPCLCLCAKKFLASLCNQILFWESSNKPTMWAHHHSQRWVGGPSATSLLQNKELRARLLWWGHLAWMVFEVVGQLQAYAAHPTPCPALSCSARHRSVYRL